MKKIELPRIVLVGPEAVYQVNEISAELSLEGRPLILCDDKTKKVAADNVAVKLDASTDVLGEITKEKLEGYRESNKEAKIQYVVGVGGGKVLDAGKIIAYNSKIPFISIPTSASHDGIASPQASLSFEKPVSVKTNCPLGVIADTSIISKAPKRLLASGCADAISNYTAVLDWRLAKKENKEYLGDYAAALSEMSAEIVMENSENIFDDVSVIVEALISSGVAIGISGTSRPCSGSEHMFSHTLETVCEKHALHGEQCGVGAIMMAYLHEADWERVRDSLRGCGAPTNAKELGIPGEKIIEALTEAHKIRQRYTILRDGIGEEKARKIAKKTGVVP